MSPTWLTRSLPCTIFLFMAYVPVFPLGKLDRLAAQKSVFDESIIFKKVVLLQYDQIGRFIRLWATFWSIWQQLICPNLPHSQAIFEKVSKSLIFLVKTFLGNFYRHLAIFSGHTDLQFKIWFQINKNSPILALFMDFIYARKFYWIKIFLKMSSNLFRINYGIYNSRTVWIFYISVKFRTRFLLRL